MHLAAFLLVLAGILVPPVVIYRVRSELRDAWWFGGAVNTVWLILGLNMIDEFLPQQRAEANEEFVGDMPLASVFDLPGFVFVSVVVTSFAVFVIAFSRGDRAGIEPRCPLGSTERNVDDIEQDRA